MKDIATKSTTSYILEKYHLQALKKYGQNFLIDSNIVEKIVSSANVDKSTCVIEVGPGIGALTQSLARYAGHVLSYEIDQRFAGVYQEFLNVDNVEIVFEDFLTIDLQQVVTSLKKKYAKVCVVANLPYYITSDIIEKVVLSKSEIDTMVVMVQKEVALKMTGEYKSPLTLAIASIGKCEYMFTVSKHVFMPSPHVDSAILKITINNSIEETLYTVLKICFKQRRKTIYNNLKQEYENAREILEKCGIDEKARSEQLSLKDFIALTNCI